MRNNRRTLARDLRVDVAEQAFAEVHPEHVNNGDENRYPNKIGSYSKGLPHEDNTASATFGEVDLDAYATLTRALTTGKAADFESIMLAGPTKLVNPQAGLAFDLEGVDAQAVTMPPAPRLDSPEAAGEIVELYWMALARDISFTEYVTNSTVADAITELNNMPGFSARPVTVDNVFRGVTPGDRRGPYVSQFLLHPVQYGTFRLTQRQETKKPNTDYLLTESDWVAIQNGAMRNPNPAADRDSERRYMRNLRDLTHLVHFDALYQHFLNACLILLDMDAPLDPGNPYVLSRTQEGFGTFGPPHVLTLVGEVATRALKAQWYQKWFVHRRLRPEAYGGLVHLTKNNPGRYPIPADVLSSQALAETEAKLGTGIFLLPQAFPEGSPTHPAYGSGHATVAGACATVLKAWFDESWPAFHRTAPMPPSVAGPATSPQQRRAVVADPNGTGLVAYTGKEALTVGDELNKLSGNIGMARDAAGVHWRTDCTRAAELGEQVAIRLLREQKDTYNEDSSLVLTKFNGDTVTI